MARLDETLVNGQAGHVSDHQVLAQKANYVYDVMDFGATGDGVTDDTVALQAADTAAAVSGGTLFVPAGTYILESTFTLSGGVSMGGVGRGVSIFKIPDGADSGSDYDMVRTEAGGATHQISHLTFDGNRQGNGSWNPIGSSTYGLNVRSDYCVVTDCEFKNVIANGAGVATLGSDVTFRDCFSHTNGKKGFHNGPVRRISYIGNSAYSNLNDSGIGAHQGIYETVISGNRCYLNGGQGIELSDSLGTPGADARESIIANNVCTDNAVHGIYLMADDSTNTDLAIHTTVSGNILLRNTAGLRIQSARYWTITNNVVKNNEEQGIYVISCEDGTVSNNVIVDNNVDETASVDAELLIQDGVVTTASITASSRITAIGNIIKDTRGTAKSVYGIAIGSNGSNHTLLGNVVQGCTTAIRNFGGFTDSHMFGFNQVDVAENTLAVEVTGSRGANAALASLLTTLETLGILKDSTS